MTFIFANNRTEFLPHLPTGGVVGEIGVNEGEFSREILTHNTPAELHLIDPWAMARAKDDYLQNPKEDGSDRFEAVRKLFEAETTSGQVKIHRAFSQDVADTFPDGFFDWLYIDGNHKYEHVKRDLELYASKVKPGGFILGHDYAAHNFALSHDFGVVEAVNEFVEAEGWSFVALSAENFPSFVIAKDAESPEVGDFIANAIFHLRPVVRINDFTSKPFNHRLAEFNNGYKKAFIEVD